MKDFNFNYYLFSIVHDIPCLVYTLIPTAYNPGPYTSFSLSSTFYFPISLSLPIFPNSLSFSFLFIMFFGPLRLTRAICETVSLELCDGASGLIRRDTLKDSDSPSPKVYP